MQLVLLAIKRRKEAANAGKAAVSIPKQLLLLCGQVIVGLVNRYPRGFGEADHLPMVRAIFCGRPWCDRSLLQRARTVRNDQVRIEINRVAKSLAARTCAVGIVE